MNDFKIGDKFYYHDDKENIYEVGEVFQNTLITVNGVSFISKYCTKIESDIDLLKEKYYSSDYVCVCTFENEVIIDNPRFQLGVDDYVLIHKKHEDILKAYLDGKEIEFHNKDDLWFPANFFIDAYDEEFDYRIKETKSYREDKIMQKITPNPNTSNALFVNSVSSCLDGIKKMLIDKNLKYGNSALEPIRIFSKSDNIEQIKVRIDDKLSRLKNQSGNEDEDVINDLIGYLVILKIANENN